MRIVKRQVTACEDMTVTIPNVPSDVDQMTVTMQPATTDTVVSENPYQPAIEQIISAIDSLGPFAKTDSLARESIANLSVVLFDLKG